MIDLRDSLGEVWARASAPVAPKRSILVMSACPGEGASSVAASLAVMAAAEARRSAWLVNLDVCGGDPALAFELGAYGDKLRCLSRPFDARIGGESFVATGEDTPRLIAQRVAHSRLVVTRFRRAGLEPSQPVFIRTSPDYWAGLQAMSDWSIVDAPALSRSKAGLAVAAQMDGVLIVVRADDTRLADVRALRRAIDDYGGRCLGVVMNRVGADARLISRLAA
ncbi:MAG: sugar kinase [Pseudomonadota bacterium]